ncbi:MoxR family ATPase [Streptomyces sp. NPDC005409]|uniref:ATP-binding protein n=1 Tax=Streptomyces sp. NPDC005409 TaxID=3155342 RepID=UPI003451C995
MQAAVTVTPAQIPELLLGLATVRPVFLWGAPGIGKSSLVRKFADSLGLECVSLLGTQLAPEDLIGVPQIRDGKSVFCPPQAIARDEPYCLFLDELNAASPDVQKAFYSLILDRRIGSYELPAGSIVIGAGNRATDNALARPIASALVNRLTHVHLTASAQDWLVWAGEHGIHPWITDYLTDRPDHLWSQPPKTEEPFSTPRSWHMLSDALHSFGAGTGTGTGSGAGSGLDEATLKVIAHGTLTPVHAVSFCGYVKIVRHSFGIEAIMKGDANWPRRPQDRDLLYYLADAFRGRLIKELPADRTHVSTGLRETAYRAKALLVQLAEISVEVAQTVIADDADGLPVLPAWFLIEAARDMPRLVEARR